MVNVSLSDVLVADEMLSSSDSLSRLGHYVAILDCDWTSVVKNATELRNDVDETLEVSANSFHIVLVVKRQSVFIGHQRQGIILWSKGRTGLKKAI